MGLVNIQFKNKGIVLKKVLGLQSFDNFLSNVLTLSEGKQFSAH